MNEGKSAESLNLCTLGPMCTLEGLRENRAFLSWQATMAFDRKGRQQGRWLARSVKDRFDDIRILKQHIVKRGGEYVDGGHFTAGGGPVDSMLALFSYLSTGVTKDRYFGIKVPPATLEPR
jgi:hypothetical protein